MDAVAAILLHFMLLLRINPFSVQGEQIVFRQCLQCSTKFNPGFPQQVPASCMKWNFFETFSHTCKLL